MPAHRTYQTARARKSEHAADAEGPSVAPPAIQAVPGLLHGEIPFATGDFPLAGGEIRRLADGDDPLGGSPVGAEISGVLRRRRGGGEPLPTDLSGGFGSHFGQDLSGVRVHADPEAGRLAQSLQSRAFTHGSDIYFAPGSYRPGTDDGRRVIAHELSHVVAQRTGADRADGDGLRVGRAADPAEAAADRSADAAMQAIRRSTGPEIYDASAPVQAPAALRRSIAELRRAPLAIGGHRGAPAPETGNTFEKGTGSYVGTQSQTKEVAQTKRGGSVGSRTETTSKAVAGAWHAAEVSDEVYNGRSKRKTEGSIESLAGAESWAKIIRESSDAQLYQAVEVLARAGAFSKGSGSASYERGQFSAGASGSYDAMAGIAGGAGASMTVDRSGLIPAVEAACNAWMRAGVGVDAEADVFAKLWKLEFLATGKVSLFAGFEASAAGKAWANWKEAGVSGEAQVFAGARASAEASATLKLGPAELTAMAEAAAKAGAWASASGKIVISFTGVEIAGEAEAFAGVSATASASAQLKFRGKQIISAKGEVSVDAGVGGKAKGKFVFKDGKIALDFGAKAVLGYGAGADLGFEIDLFALGKAISVQVYEGITKYTLTITEDAGAIDRQPIVDPLKAMAVKKLGYDIYLPHFRGYAASKLGGGKNGIKRERVQEILDEYRGAIGRNLLFAEADAGIMQAAEEAFGKMLRRITITGGKITDFAAVNSAEIGEVRVDHAQQQAKAALRAALTKAADAGRAGSGKKAGTHAPDGASIGKALKSSYSDLVAAYGKDRALADAEAAAVIEEVFSGLLTHVVVRNGALSSAVVNTARAQAADADTENKRTVAERLGALAALQSACSQYAAKKAAGGKNGIKQDEVAKIIDTHAKPLLAARDISVAERVITDTVRGGLGAAIVDFIYSGGEIRAFKIADPAAIKAAHAADAAATARRGRYAAAKKEIAAYVAKKTRKGESGIKLGPIQSIVSGVYGKVPEEFRGEADGQLAQAVTEACTGLVDNVAVVGGKLSYDLIAAAMSAAKEKYAADAARVGKNFGDDQGNDRRYDVARKIRPVMEQYLAELRSTPGMRPQIGQLQGLIDRAMASRKDELAFEDAQAELVLTINRVFDGVLTVQLDQAGRLQKMSANPVLLAQMRKVNPYRSAVSAALARYAAGLGKKKPTATGVEAVIAKVPVTGVDSAERDSVLMEAIRGAFAPGRVITVLVTDAAVRSFDLAW